MFIFCILANADALKLRIVTIKLQDYVIIYLPFCLTGTNTHAQALKNLKKKSRYEEIKQFSVFKRTNVAWMLILVHERTFLSVFGFYDEHIQVPNGYYPCMHSPELLFRFNICIVFIVFLAVECFLHYYMIFFHRIISMLQQYTNIIIISHIYEWIVLNVWMCNQTAHEFFFYVPLFSANI